MNLGAIAAVFEICAGLGAVGWGVNLGAHGLREHRRKVTQEVEILDSVTLPTGISYRFTPVTAVKGDAPAGAAAEEYSGTPCKFGDPSFSAGDRVLIDHDPGHQLFFYPAGRYPRARLWPIALTAVVIGSASAVLGVGNLL
ncbi:hypothetical protein [Streptomyces sp. V3I7]|uniref:hypothetical protein n=1 Tax=Streptomyces sp. V3I7 TaxID=3042278 RepID=UPI00278A685B|nr:hypothetical protein [Streptomyces sp. V3I7]MDQ0992029.1 hypothetical protein [Streptomyces sp. V3I7]